jgi:hypothetical protein
MSQIRVRYIGLTSPAGDLDGSNSAQREDGMSYVEGITRMGLYAEGMGLVGR